MSAEAVDLMTPAAQAPVTNQIEVYYINYLTQYGAKSLTRGEAFSSAFSPSVGYEDSVIIAGNYRNPVPPFVFAHEIGHVLTDANHVLDGNWSVNLMRDGGTSNTDTILASKRLTSSQDVAVHWKRPNLLK